MSLSFYKYIGLFLLCILLTGTIFAKGKQQIKPNKVNVSLKVVDYNSIPIPGANVVVGEGIIHTKTDKNGSSSFNANPDDVITISFPGYESCDFKVREIPKDNTIKLVKSKLFMSSDDDVHLPFLDLKKRTTTGSSSVIKGEKLEMYPSTDLRNALTGLVTGLQITEMNGAPGPNAEERNNDITKIKVRSRGSDMIYIVDDIPVDINELQIDPSEIESVTVIKDIVGKAMYGTAGAGGIINIKTKRGKANERILTVNVEEGVNSIDRMPGMVSGADYARLNNQARKADGLDENYTESDIAAYGMNNPYDMFHPSVNYRSLMLKNSMAFRRVNVSSSGGNETVKYFAYLGYNGEGDIYKIGSAADYSRINSRGNIDVKINDALKIKFDIFAGVSFRRSPNYGYGSGLPDLLEFNSAVSDINTTPPIEFPVYANNDSALPAPWYAVSQNYSDNPIGNLVGNGFYTDKGRTGVVSTTLDYDMSGIIKGLSSSTFLSYNGLNLVRIGQANNYAAYTVTPGKNASTGNDTITLVKVHDGDDNTDLVKLHDYDYQRYTFYERLKYERTFGNKSIQSTFTYFQNKFTRKDHENPQREQNAVWTGVYSVNDKYSIQGTLNYSGSSSMSESKMFDLYPSLGASWVILDESPMSNMKTVNYLKLRAEGGILGYEDFMAPFLYRERWTETNGGATFGPSALSTRWFGTTQEGSVYTTEAIRMGNPDLSLEKRKEFNIGLDALMLKRKLTLEITYYNNLWEGQISRLSNIPYIVGISAALPYFNYNSTRYFGVEASIQYTNNIGDFGFSFGGNATVQDSKLVKYDEPAYRNGYQYHTGLPADTYWGQTYLGKFSNDAETLEVPQLYSAELKQGDLKYKDMNGDGVVDDNDMSAIGHTTPRLYYAVNANLKYKNFDFNIIGTGCAFYDIPLTNSYYWDGWGNNNYSNFVKNNIGGAYPRLTYYKVNNNFVASNFWLTKGGYFKIQNVELAYNIAAFGGLRLYVRGANLLTFSKVKDVDPESINSGVSMYPLFKTLTCGIKLTF